MAVSTWSGPHQGAVPVDHIPLNDPTWIREGSVFRHRFASFDGAIGRNEQRMSVPRAGPLFNY
jgi:hypothetical protein